ncbi:MAG: hypothetical protein BMS9Abin23_0107 [Thermodesulfobacteriota bacterium]|nr:MAG: hypothetical protein BMS9Abin23_0107 [Thermodesulfobacteriota bacterium]
MPSNLTRPLKVKAVKSSVLVDKEFKLRFGLKFCLFTIAGFFVMTLFLYSVTSRSLVGSYGEAIYTIYNLRINIFSLVFASFYSIAILVFVALSIAVISIFFSHKMAGPLYRIEKDLDLLRSGDLTVETRLRDKDQLMLLAGEQNRMVRSLNHIVRTSLDALSEMERAEEKIYALLGDGSKPSKEEISRALKDLASGVDALKKSASRVVLKGK